MIILKTFALSQLVFSSQFMNLKTQDVKRVESLCYKFVWNGKMDRIKRAYLKNKKEVGGINGVDIECFVRAIQTRQFLKAEMRSEMLRSIQSNPLSNEDITISARDSIFRLYKLCYNADSDCFQSLSQDDKLKLANYDIRGFTKHGTRCDKTIQNLEISSLAILNDSIIPRGKLNIINKAVPITLRAELIDDYEYSPVHFGLFYKGSHILLHKCPSKMLQQLLKTALKKVEERPNTVTNWKNIWRVGNPTLRAVLFKIAHNDVFCNRKRFQCKIVSDDKCNICGLPEDVEHQLLTCPNAQRLWLNCHSTFGIRVQTMDDIRNMNCSKVDLMIIGVILKALIQIDRSKEVNWDTIVHRIRSYLSIENKVKRSFMVTETLLKIT